ncbi:TDT family transporter [Gordonia sp. NPDC058843]|uniref:TDT family transporter n=1 Tax=Gordonia sp. NPDC058843 TaxID=3346648 RepID=UPI00368EA92B
MVDMTTMTATAGFATTDRGTAAPVKNAQRRNSYVPPNWFAAVMGTGIVAIAAHSLPWQPVGLVVVATVFWLLACAVFAVVLVATVRHWVRDPEVARGHHDHRVVAHFYGAVPMAVMTVGTSTMVVGATVIGRDLALGIDVVCWIVGTVGGVITAVVIPYRHLIIGRPTVGDAFGGWLMPVVPPMVSASAAAVLTSQMSASWASHVVMGIGCAMFVVAALASLPILAVLAARLRTGDVGAAQMVPTWWIVLGPLGQSVTAACLLAHVAPRVVAVPMAGTLHSFAVGYGLTAWVAATLWIVVAARLTARTLRSGMPFAMTWWSFTFPLGTYVTGSSALALTVGGTVFEVVAVAGFTVLVVAWSVVAVRTVRGVVSGELLLAPGAPVR